MDRTRRLRRGQSGYDPVRQLLIVVFKTLADRLVALLIQELFAPVFIGLEV